MFYLNFDTFEIVDIILASLIAIAFSFLCIKKIHNKTAVFTFLILITSLVVSSFFPKLKATNNILLAIFIIFSTICFFINISSFRNITNIFSRNKKHHIDKKPDEITDDEKYKIIDEAIRILSKTKTGALLTFEKNNDLTEYMKNGSIINSPLSIEIIQTIFYPGTRLHDGAIIIRGNIIVAASVYYTPTTRALTGKYGSRHRAALGFSEETDAVTIVVSEETGRISIAYKGKLEPVPQDQFLEIFKNYMQK